MERGIARCLLLATVQITKKREGAIAIAHIAVKRASGLDM